MKVVKYNSLKFINNSRLRHNRYECYVSKLTPNMAFSDDVYRHICGIETLMDALHTREFRSHSNRSRNYWFIIVRILVVATGSDIRIYNDMFGINNDLFLYEIWWEGYLKLVLGFLK